MDIYSNYDENKSNIFSLFDKIVEEYKNTLICFISETLDKEGRVCGFESFGSGFLIEYLQHKFLITARHVIDEMKSRSQSRGLIIRGPQNAIKLHIKRVLANNHGSDAAVILVDDIVGFNDLAGIQFAKIEEAIDRNNLTHGLFLGFPFSQNRNKPKFKDVIFTMNSYSANYTDKKIRVSNVSNPLFFSIDIKRTVSGVNREPTSISGPDPYGMSGGPVIGIFCLLLSESEDEKIFGLVQRITGIGVQYLKNNNIFVAEDICTITDFIDNIFSKNYPDSRR